MPKIVKSFKSVSGSVVNPQGFRSSRPARAKLANIPTKEDSTVIEVLFPFGPQNVDHATLEGVTASISRPGRKPLLVHENEQLRTVSFDAVLADKASGGTRPITDIIDNLETLAATSLPCSFIYGLTSLSYNVVITRLNINVSYRNGAGEPLRAEASIQLTETPVFNQDVLELKAVVKTVPAATQTYSKGGGDVTGGGNTQDDEEGAVADSQLPTRHVITPSERAYEEQRKRNYAAAQSADRKYFQQAASKQATFFY